MRSPSRTRQKPCGKPLPEARGIQAQPGSVCSLPQAIFKHRTKSRRSQSGAGSPPGSVPRPDPPCTNTPHSCHHRQPIAFHRSSAWTPTTCTEGVHAASRQDLLHYKSAADLCQAAVSGKHPVCSDCILNKDFSMGKSFL